MDWDEEERRVAEILGVQEGDEIPHVSRQTLRTYHAYLRANVKFPFKAKVEDLDGESTIHNLLDLDECPELTFYGLFALGRHRGHSIETPLVDVFEVEDKGRNKQLLEDYCMWFWNYR